MKLVQYLFLLLFLQGFSQEALPEKVRDTTFFTKIDSLYREDQFYLAITYNSLFKTPDAFKQNKIPLGIHAGFLRDMPINKARTFAVGVGLGLSYNKYHQNLLFSENLEGYDYQIVDEDVISKNKMELFYVEVPFELRWRTSTPESHKFFRIHAGFKLRYLAFSKNKYVGDFATQIITNNKDFNKLQYGPTLSMGYNTWNFYAYYSLNSIMKNGIVEDENLQFKTFHLGLIFYIL